MSQAAKQTPAPRWGEFPTPERQAELTQRLQAWDQEREHGERQGPFDNTGLASPYISLTGADVFWLAARAAGNGDVIAGKAELTGPDSVILSNLQLKGASLEKANLKGAYLHRAQLQGAHFSRTELQNADLSGAQLQSAGIILTELQNANLDRAELQGANFTWSNLNGARLTGASLDVNTKLIGVTFDAQTRVANVVWNGVPLTGVDWEQVPTLGDEAEARKTTRMFEAAKILQHKSADDRESDYQVAARAYLQLAIALQGQGIIETADRYTYRARVMQRKALWWRLRSRKFSKFGSYLFSVFLAALTGYGFRMWRIVAAYALIVLAFATAYWGLGFQAPPNLSFPQAIIVSVTAFHGRVFANPFTLNEPQIAVTALEAIFGLVIEGVFIAMLTQRFFSR